MQLTTIHDSEVVMHESVRWAVLGPGNIARRFASQLPASRRGRLVGVGGRDAVRAAAFAEEFVLGQTAVVGSYEDVIASEEIDAVYVSVVHTAHARLAIAALEAGKHVLCEKPLAPNHAAVMAMVDAARRSGSTLLEAYMYRFHPQTIRVLDLVASGEIGDVVHVDAAFAFDTGGRDGRLFDPALAGGAILDVGGYPMSLARLVAGAATGAPVREPASVSGAGRIGPTGVDEWATADLTFPGGITATLRAAIRMSVPSVATITGSRGMIRLEDPWALGERQEIVLDRVGESAERISIPASHSYALEADALADAAGHGEVDAWDLDASTGQALALDRWRSALDLRYPFEEDGSRIPTVSGAPLRVSPGSRMPYGRIEGVAPRISRLVMGCDNQPNLAHASALFDAFFEAGGTAFDTGYIYGGGLQERLLGTWMANRGVRDQSVVIVKGAHTPHCDPESLQRQLEESLDRLGTDYADLYLMHRDDPRVPVGEFIDVLDENVRAGRIRAFGGSNWEPRRVDAANAYAQRESKHGFRLLSNHFGLAEALDVPWDGCVHATDPASKAWLEARQIPLFPWSSQARGFFAGRADPEERSDAELVRCYYSDENFERLRRARHLSAALGVPATAVALAFVLAQPFPTYPLIGPRSIAELRSSMRGLDVTLSASQVAWLDLREVQG